MGRAALMLVCVLVPLGGAFVLPLLGRISALLRNLCALCLVCVSLVCSLLLVPGALAGDVVTWTAAGPLGISFTLTADALAVFMAVVSSLVGAIIMLFSFDYISHYKNQDEYYLMAVLFLGAMMGLVFSANLIFLFVFWEITGIASWRLIGFYRGQGRRPARRQGLPGHRLRRPAHAAGNRRGLRADRVLRPGRAERHQPCRGSSRGCSWWACSRSPRPCPSTRGFLTRASPRPR